MTPLELRLLNLTEGEPEAQLRQLRSYLYQLTEQLRWLWAAGKRPQSHRIPKSCSVKRWP